MSTETINPNISKLENIISKATADQIDILWAILKYKEIGIYRKVKCMCAVLGADLEAAVNLLPKDQEGRILDYKSRHMIHDVLIKYS